MSSPSPFEHTTRPKNVEETQGKERKKGKTVPLTRSNPATRLFSLGVAGLVLFGEARLKYVPTSNVSSTTFQVVCSGSFLEAGLKKFTTVASVRDKKNDREILD